MFVCVEINKMKEKASLYNGKRNKNREREINFILTNDINKSAFTQTQKR